MICCFQFQEKKPLRGVTGLLDWRLLGRLSQLHITDRFSGSRGESLLVLPGNRLPADYLVLLGAGSERLFQSSIDNGTGEQVLNELLNEMFHCARRLNVTHITLSLPGRNEDLISGEASTQLFFQLCPALLRTESEFSIAIIDTFETHPIIAAEAERHRRRTDLTPLSTTENWRHENGENH